MLRQDPLDILVFFKRRWQMARAWLITELDIR